MLRIFNFWIDLLCDESIQFYMLDLNLWWLFWNLARSYLLTKCRFLWVLKERKCTRIILKSLCIIFPLSILQYTFRLNYCRWYDNRNAFSVNRKDGKHTQQKLPKKISPFSWQQKLFSLCYFLLPSFVSLFALYILPI